jgi:uncharacterized membrane protein AbrB (regulator of aidB expression)
MNFLRVLLLLVTPPITFIVVVLVYSAIQLLWHGASWWLYFGSVAIGCAIAIKLPSEIAISNKVGWAIYGVAWCLLYSVASWASFFLRDDGIRDLPIAAGSLLGVIAGVIEIRKALMTKTG